MGNHGGGARVPIKGCEYKGEHGEGRGLRV